MFMLGLKNTDVRTILAKSGMNFNKDAPSTFGILMASILMGAIRLAYYNLLIY